MKRPVGQCQVEHDNRSQPFWSTAFKRPAPWFCQKRLKPELQRINTLQRLSKTRNPCVSERRCYVESTLETKVRTISDISICHATRLVFRLLVLAINDPIEIREFLVLRACFVKEFLRCCLRFWSSTLVPLQQGSANSIVDWSV